MATIDAETGLKILHAACVAIDGKAASTFKPETEPYSHRTFADFKQQTNDSTATPTTRTKAMLLAFTLYSAGRIPYEGVKTGDRWLVLDDWVAGALVKWHYAVPDDDARALIVTPKGWQLIASTLEAMA